MAQSSPAWKRLVEEGWFDSRSDAERWILSGKVRAGNVLVTSAGQPIKNDLLLSVRGINQRYVAKGGLKLEGALKAFHMDITGRVCIDAGASTGGFTDCLVQHGAKRVYAVDVGYGQLAGSLRANPAIINMERRNIGDDTLLSLDPRPTLGTVDLSYLSLRKAVPIFANILRNTGDLLCLVKPLFEIDDPGARRSGQVPDEAYAPLLLELMDDFIMEDYTVSGITHSPVTGNNGTLEFFLHLSLDKDESLSADLRKQSVLAAIDAARALPIYHKA